MPGAVWFPEGRLNFGQHLLRHGASERDAVVLVTEAGDRASLTFGQLRTQAAAVAGRLRSLGVGPGDRVVGYLPNCLEGVVAFAAVALIGAVWAQAGLDYAAAAAADRLGQLTPTVLIAGSGYRFGGRVHDRRSEVSRLRELLPDLAHTITVATGGVQSPDPDARSSSWAEALAAEPDGRAEAVPFEHPLWVLFTSGTTGKPKGIVHGHGGVLLEQLVSPGLHMDLHEGDVFFWFTTPNWMMWNAQVVRAPARRDDRALRRAPDVPRAGRALAGRGRPRRDRVRYQPGLSSRPRSGPAWSRGTTSTCRPCG